MKLPRDIRKKISEYAFNMEPSSNRAQLCKIYHYDLETGQTIADKLLQDHRAIDSCLRVAQLLVNAGVAKEINKRPDLFGTFIFFDGSTLND